MKEINGVIYTLQVLEKQTFIFKYLNGQIKAF